MDVYEYRRYILNRGENAYTWQGREVNDNWEDVVLRLPISVARQYSWLWGGARRMRSMSDYWSNHPLVNSGDAYWLNERTLCLGYKLRSNNAIYRPIFSLISLIPNTYAYKEKGLLVINYKKSSLVAGAGLEPATFGL